MSLRSWRSWMPARKSWASRIIGERLVRPMAVSTSISTLARVPWTISTRIGSTVAPRGRQPVAVLVGRGQAGRVHRLRGDVGRVHCAGADVGSSGRLLRDHEVAESSTADARSRGGPGWSSRTPRRSPGRSKVSPAPRSARQYDRGVDVARARRRSRPRAGCGRRARATSPSALSRARADLGAGDRADAGDAEVDPLDLLGRVAAEVVAVELRGARRGTASATCATYASSTVPSGAATRTSKACPK